MKIELGRAYRIRLDREDIIENVSIEIQEKYWAIDGKKCTVLKPQNNSALFFVDVEGIGSTYNTISGPIEYLVADAELITDFKLICEGILDGD